MLNPFTGHRSHWTRKLSILCSVVVLAALAISCQPLPAPNVAPDVDRIGYPENYQDEFTVFYEFDRPDNKTARVIYANDAAATVQPGEPFPYGSILVMDVYRTQQDEEGNVLLDDDGRYLRGDLFGAFVMGKEPGFSQKYGQFRNGEWEYVAYRPDGSTMIPPENTTGCANCHMEAGLGKDWVFGAHRHFGTEPALNTDENAVNLIDYAFQTETITVTTGSEVTWSNNDVVIHNVLSPDMLFNSGALRQQSSFSHVFEEAGVYDYICAIHPAMRGTVVVTEEN